MNISIIKSAFTRERIGRLFGLSTITTAIFIYVDPANASIQKFFLIFGGSLLVITLVFGIIIGLSELLALLVAGLSYLVKKYAFLRWIGHIFVKAYEKCDLFIDYMEGLLKLSFNWVLRGLYFILIIALVVGVVIAIIYALNNISPLYIIAALLLAIFLKMK